MFLPEIVISPESSESRPPIILRSVLFPEPEGPRITYIFPSPKDRLTPRGYGWEKPKTVRKKMTEKYPWLKEGDVLTTEFITKQTKEHQEICNQLNRRTEFIVLRTTYGLFDEKGNLKNPPQPKQKKENKNAEDVFDIDF